MKLNPFYTAMSKPWLTKTILVMKITTFLILIAVMECGAHAAFSQTVNLQENHAPLSKVLKLITRQTGYVFFYDSKDVVGKNVTINVKNAELNAALTLCLKDQELTFKMVKNTILLQQDEQFFNKLISRLKPQLTISGQVLDEKEQPLAGGSVKLKNGTAATVTDANGKFKLEVPDADAILVFSFVGYVTQELGFTPGNPLIVRLQIDQSKLSEVVVVGYGTQKKSSFTGAVSTASGKDIEDIPVSTISNALAGRLPGLSVVNQSGVPGTTAGMTIRGTGTYNNSSPLYVIDGVIRDQTAMDGLDPNEIATVTVLKDAVSSAVYGSRAANGVILVTTKRGGTQAPQIDYKVSYGIKSPSRPVKNMNAFEQANFTNAYVRNIYNQDVQKAMADLQYYTPDELDYFKTHSYNWLDYSWKDPGTLQHSLTVNGGSENVKYFMSAGYFNEKGGFENTDNNRLNLRSNVDAKIAKNLTASLNIDGFIRKTQRPFNNYDNDVDPDGLVQTYGAFLSSTVFAPPYINGKPIAPTVGVPWNPAAMLTESGYNHYNNRSINAQLALEYQVPFLEGLSLKGTYSFNSMEQVYKYLNKAYTLYSFAREGGHNHIMTDEVTGQISISQIPSDRVGTSFGQSNNTQLDLFATYNKNFGKHHVNAVFVYEQAEGNNNNFGGYRHNLLTPSIDQLFNGSTDPNSFNGAESESGRLSYVGRLDYDYAGKYVLQTSFREDGSYIFAPGHQWGFFPSAGVAWVISEEEFFKRSVPFVNRLKLRSSIGLLGNDAVNPFQFQSVFGVGNGPYFGGNNPAIATGVYPNPDITWEKTRMTNIGLDAGLLKNKLSLSFDYFWKHTYDMLFTRNNTIPGTFGISLPSQNYGIVDVKGYEISANYADKIGQVQYRIGANVGYSKDNVTFIDVAPGTPDYLSPLGHPIAKLQGYQSTGIIRSDADLASMLVLQGFTPSKGSVGFADLYGPNGAGPDGIVNGNDLVILSDNATPRYNYGFNLGASWKNFDLDLFFSGLGGWDKLLSDNGGSGAGQSAFWTDYYSAENPNAKFPSSGPNNGSNSAPSSFWLINASFLRLKTANLSYNLPKKWASKAGLKNLRVYLTGDNLFLLISHEKFMDPEAYSLGSYPIMRNVVAGINVTF